MFKLKQRWVRKRHYQQHSDLLPERFDLTYIGQDGEHHRPVVIHRGVVSTMERFVAF